jgi:hypothetical protein
VSKRLILDRKQPDTTGWRVPVQDIERLVLERVGQFLNSEPELFRALESITPEVRERAEQVKRIQSVTVPWSKLPAVRRKTLLHAVLKRVDLRPGFIDVSLRVELLVRLAEGHMQRALARDVVTSDADAYEPITPTNFTRILKMGFVAPDVIEAMLRDRHPLELTAHKLWRETEIPAAGSEQRARLCAPGNVPAAC